MVSRRCQYAVRALFELAKRHRQGPMRITDIARAQAIPVRFLEVILSELKQAGFVASQRGTQGGYVLLREPGALTVGEVIRFIEGPMAPVECLGRNSGENCPLYGDCVFLPMWQEAEAAVAQVYDGTTFQQLVEREIQMKRDQAPEYVI